MSEVPGATVVAPLGAILLASLWQGCLIAGATACGLRLLRGATPQVRYVLAWTGLVLMAVVPVVTVFTPGAAGSGTSVGWPQELVGVASVLTSPTSMALVAWTWLGGVGIGLAWAVGQWRAARALTVAPTFLGGEWLAIVERLGREMGVTRVVTIATSVRVHVPCVVGWLRPMLLMPVGALTGLPPAQLEAILAHELAHVRRHDYLFNVIQMGLEILLFHHPAAWWLSRRIRLEREQCCDRLAAVACGDALACAHALAAMESLRSSAPPALAVTGGPLLARIERLAAPAMPSRGPFPGWPVAFALLLVGVGAAWFLVGGLSVVPAAPAGTRPVSAAFVMAIVLGLVVGVRHVLEPDHLVTVATLVTTERRARDAVRIGASWGVGHATALAIMALVLAAVRMRVPAGFTAAIELGVATTLLIIGAGSIRSGLRLGRGGPVREHTHGAFAHCHGMRGPHMHIGPWTVARRPLAIGVLHGLAGSGPLTALIVSTLPTDAARLAFVLLFGIASTLAMTVLSACAGWPLQRFARAPRTLAAVSVAAGVAAIAIGLSAGAPLVRLFAAVH